MKFLRYLLLAAVAGCSGAGTGSTEHKLAATCEESELALEPDGWICGADRTVQCTSGVPERLYFIESGVCADNVYTLSDQGPFAPGEHVVSITRTSSTGSSTTCESLLTVLDDPPVATSHSLSLWPPNHELHHISPEDCVTVTDGCDASVDVHFTYATSDEPVNDRGDGNHEPDILLSCDGVELRAERQGPENGRYYRLGWRAEDSAGNVVDGECTVVVDHDQSPRSAGDDGEAYRVELAPDACDSGTSAP